MFCTCTFLERNGHRMDPSEASHLSPRLTRQQSMSPQRTLSPATGLNIFMISPLRLIFHQFLNQRMLTQQTVISRLHDIPGLTPNAKFGLIPLRMMIHQNMRNPEKFEPPFVPPFANLCQLNSWWYAFHQHSLWSHGYPCWNCHFYILYLFFINFCFLVFSGIVSNNDFFHCLLRIMWIV